jgi:hypothetical protein
LAEVFGKHQQTQYLMSQNHNGNDEEEQAPLVSSVKTLRPSPSTITSTQEFVPHKFTDTISLELIKRVRALTLALLPVEVDAGSINDPTSRVITPHVIEGYVAAAGDFVEAVCPNILIFVLRCEHDRSNSCPIVCFEPGQSLDGMRTTTSQITVRITDGVSDLFQRGRSMMNRAGKRAAVACEVLARRIVHQAPPDRLGSIMSTRFKHLQADGDESDLASALELAIDTYWCAIQTNFLP